MNREGLLNGWTKKRRVMRRYDLTAYLYDRRYREEQEAEYKAALKHILIKRSDIVLDIGCGTGLLFTHVSGKAKMVFGIDSSRKTLVKAKKRAARLGNVQVILADADHLPLRSAVVTLVFAFTLAQNVPNPLVTLRELRDTMYDRAMVVFSGLKRVFSLREFKGLLSEAGLKVAFLELEGLQSYVAVCELIH